MRFRTRYDAGLVVVQLVAFVGLLVLRLRSRAVSPLGWLDMLFLAIWALVPLSTLPRYYDVRDDGLFLRRGWRRNLIPYASLTELELQGSRRGGGLLGQPHAGLDPGREAVPDRRGGRNGLPR
jgi:hypothetical protein